MDSAADNKTRDKIKVVTYVNLKITAGKRRHLPSWECRHIFAETCFVAELETNITLEEYVRSLCEITMGNNLTYHFPSTGRRVRNLHSRLRGLLDQVTVYVELTEKDGRKIFDFMFPFTADEDWDTTLGQVHDRTKAQSGQSDADDKPEWTDDKLERKTRTSEWTDADDANLEKMRNRQERFEKQLRKMTSARHQPAEKEPMDGFSPVKEVKAPTREDFNKIVGKNLILRVYNY